MGYKINPALYQLGIKNISVGFNNIILSYYEFYRPNMVIQNQKHVTCMFMNIKLFNFRRIYFIEVV